MRITIDHTKIDAALTDFPILIKVPTDVFSELTTDAERKKIAVTVADGTTQCAVEIEYWDHANQDAVIHVKVPSVSDTADTDLYLYFDHTQADNTAYVGDTGETPAQNVWDVNFVGVWHLAQDPSGGSGCIKDSTSNANHGTPEGSMTSADLVTDETGRGLDFDGIDDYVDCGNDASLRLTSNFTVEAIFVPRSGGSTTLRSIVTKYQHASGYRGWGLRYNTDGNKIEIGFRKGSADYILYRGATSMISGQTFSLQMAYKGDGSTPMALLDGVSEALTTVLNAGNALHGIGDSGTPLTIARGNLFSSADFQYNNGMEGEIRYSKIARSSAWMRATHYSIRSQLLTFSPVESAPELIAYVDMPMALRVRGACVEDLPCRLMAAEHAGWDLRLCLQATSGMVSEDMGMMLMATDGMDIGDNLGLRLVARRKSKSGNTAGMGVYQRLRVIMREV